MNWLAALLLVAASAHGEYRVPAPGRMQPDSVRQFPRVKGTNLEGRPFTLPADFEGEYNVVIVAFRREQQEDVDTWLPFLREVAEADNRVRVYELPTLARAYRVMRGFIDGGMARGIPERATREATITLYIDKSPFKSALAIATEDHISTLLVSRQGQVLWQASGRYSAVAAGGLAIMLNRLRAPVAPPQLHDFPAFR